MSYRILVVEDDDGIALPLMRTLAREGYEVERADTGRAAVDRLAQAGVDIVVLDLGLPDIDGLEVCRIVRAAGCSSPILILTARAGELDRVVGLDVGADDYMSKPFSLAELLARVRALLRRTAGSPVGASSAGAGLAADGPPAPPGRQAPASLRVDVAARRVWQGDREIALTSKEFDVLALLCTDRGSVVTRERLMDEVWDENWFGSTKTLDVTVARLRQKLEHGDSTSTLVTVRGVGFRLDDSRSDA